MNKVVWSRKSDEWSTPKDLYNSLNAIYKFTLDPCSNGIEKLAPKNYTINDNGLKKSWENERVFCNPPYSDIKSWVIKAVSETNCFIVMLLPARTDTKWFHEYLYHNPDVEIKFIKGRLKFGENKNSAPFPSMLVFIKRGVTK